MNVAVVQNEIAYGGRLSVIVQIVRILNERNIVPDILTYRTDIIGRGIKDKYGEEIEFNVRTIESHYSRLPSEGSIMCFGMSLGRYKNNYDYFIDSNNTSFMMPKDIPTISYVHFPRKARLMAKHVSIHNPEGIKRSWSRTSGIFLNLCRFFYLFNNKIGRKNLIIANSEFSRTNFKKCYPAYSANVSVIYPPVRIPTGRPIPLDKKENAVVSVGRFCPDKNQFRQVLLAQQVPDMKFHIVGFCGQENDVFDGCRQYVEDHNLRNVFLHPHVDDERKSELLDRSKYFIHTTVNEPFGISTVEAILRGCIPLSHDSGGQKEIVILDELRYNNIEDLVGFFQRKTSEATLEKWSEKLMTHCRQFCVDNFRRKVSEVLTNLESDIVRGTV